MQNIELILFGVFVGFFIYAVLLLFPIYRFMQKEEELAEDITREELQRQLDQVKQQSPADDTHSSTERSDD